MILVISGYREFNDYNKFEEVLDNFINENGNPELIIFGECRGTDKLAFQYVQKNKLPFKIYYADWKMHGLSAGPKRNNEMIKVATHMVAFLSDKSKGTKQAIESAEGNGLIVTCINI